MRPPHEERWRAGSLSVCCLRQARARHLRRPPQGPPPLRSFTADPAGGSAWAAAQAEAQRQCGLGRRSALPAPPHSATWQAAPRAPSHLALIVRRGLGGELHCTGRRQTGETARPATQTMRRRSIWSGRALPGVQRGAQALNIFTPAQTQASPKRRRAEVVVPMGPQARFSNLTCAPSYSART